MKAQAAQFAFHYHSTKLFGWYVNIFFHFNQERGVISVIQMTTAMHSFIVYLTSYLSL